jgi:hypothetical protein
LPYATGPAGLAITVRGSSRRIMIMRFRPANIRLINRRLNLPRLLLALSSGKGKNNGNYKNNPTDSAELTRSLHIRAKHSSSIGLGIFIGLVFENVDCDGDQRSRLDCEIPVAMPTSRYRPRKSLCCPRIDSPDWRPNNSLYSMAKPHCVSTTR